METHEPCGHRLGDRVDGEQQHVVSWSDIIGVIGRSLSIKCLLRLSRSDYGSVACLNQDFNSLVRSGEIYRLHRNNGVEEYWLYFSRNPLQWDAYDPHCGRWIEVPRMPQDECFMCSDKESLAVGTELLVFGMAHIVYKYSILTNSWTRAGPMNSPLCLFGSTSAGEKAYVAGGIDSLGRKLSAAEMYNSETHAWTPLPCMNEARMMCSGAFMDGKFYVIGGVTNNNKVLKCGEEYDLERGSWRVIENMCEGVHGMAGAPPLIAGATPLIVVVNNQLYAANYNDKDVKRYDKLNNRWIALGKLPEHCVSKDGWGIAFRACGDRLIVIGGPRTYTGGTIEIHSWIPDDQQPPVWNLVAKRSSKSFLYNLAMMGC
ncbi:hypothetical protein CFC21_106381 [Triticum aestivum]|uniref:F-box domain-containing protein n=2 Tax=Triticum aestivum TaxID=4565 RepID=A0A3B6T7A8_WHEAT|nr:F-box/kelch-repeat protein SKIP11-like [Triticum aestivum]KAF7105592.1 hypothetical protein CFC21_106381 [Triticum aestivum]